MKLGTGEATGPPGRARGVRGRGRLLRRPVAPLRCLPRPWPGHPALQPRAPPPHLPSSPCPRRGTQRGGPSGGPPLPSGVAAPRSARVRARGSGEASRRGTPGRRRDGLANSRAADPSGVRPNGARGRPGPGPARDGARLRRDRGSRGAGAAPRRGAARRGPAGLPGWSGGLLKRPCGTCPSCSFLLPRDRSAPSPTADPRPFARAPPRPSAVAPTPLPLGLFSARLCPRARELPRPAEPTLGPPPCHLPPGAAVAPGSSA